MSENEIIVSNDNLIDCVGRQCFPQVIEQIHPHSGTTPNGESRKLRNWLVKSPERNVHSELSGLIDEGLNGCLVARSVDANKGRRA